MLLSLASCRHEERAPAPSASASAAGSDFTERARAQHFQAELSRASTRFRTKQSLADCAAALKEKADLELCQAAEAALAPLTLPVEPASTEDTLTRLASGALTLARLSERLRYLALAELAQQRLEGDAGAAQAPSPSAAASVSQALAAHAHAHAHAHDGQQGVAKQEQRALKLSDSPVSRLLDSSIHLERDVLRNLGAYLEYGPLAVRRAAFATVERLRGEHPKWPLLDHLIRDAAVLEADRDLKRDLAELSASGLPERERPAQSAATK